MSGNGWELPSSETGAISLEKIIEKFMTEEKTNSKNQSGKKTNNIASATNLESLGAVGGVGGVGDETQMIVSSASGAVRKRPRSNGEVSSTTGCNVEASSATSSVTSSISSDSSVQQKNISPGSCLAVPDPSPNPSEGGAVTSSSLNPVQCMREISNKLMTWQESLSSNAVGGDQEDDEEAMSSSNDRTLVLTSGETSMNSLSKTGNITISIESGDQRSNNINPNETVTIVSEDDNSISQDPRPVLSDQGQPSLPREDPGPIGAVGGAESGQDEEGFDTDGRGYEQDDEDEEDEDEDEQELRFEGGDEGEQGL